MNIVLIDGGLGNQIFQLAFALYLKTSQPDPVALETRQDGKRHQHGVSGLAELAQALGLPYLKSPPSRAHTKAALSFRSLATRRLVQPFVTWQTGVRFGKIKVWAGYWQNVKDLEPYYRIVADRIAETFPQPQGISRCAHLRLGDYTQGRALKVYNQVGATYYKTALQTLQSSEKETAELCLVSNDQTGAQKLFSDVQTVPPPPSQISDPVLADFTTLTRAETLIASNSTFCWWTALVSARQGRLHTLTYPEHWFQPGYRHRERPDYARLAEISGQTIALYPIPT